MDNLATLLQPVVQIAILIAVGAGITYAQKHWGLKLSQDAIKTLDDQITKAVGVQYAKADAEIDNAALSVSDPKVRTALQIVLQTAPKQLIDLGLTPDQLATLVLAKFGQYQSASATTPQS